MSDAIQGETGLQPATVRYRRNRGWDEMPKMCELPLAGGEVVYVNPLNVLYARDQDAGTTLLYFNDKQLLAVEVPIATAIRLLDTAMNVDH